jgi:hypothetical protein
METARLLQDVLTDEDGAVALHAVATIAASRLLADA